MKFTKDYKHLYRINKIDSEIKNKSYLNENFYEYSFQMHNHWKDILELKHQEQRNIEKIENLIFNGIPSFLRSNVYSMFIGKNECKIDYNYYKNIKSKYENQIDMDVQRTFRSHPLFKEKYGAGQCRLFNILVSYSNYKPEIGYCQGMSSIVAVILMYFSEEEAFMFLEKLIKKNKLESLFDKKLSKLNLLLQVQKMVFEEEIPEIDSHFEKECILSTLYSTSWYLTLFTRFRLKLCLRIWDLFIFYDFSILIYLVVAILKYFENEILNFEGEILIEFVSKIEIFEIDVDRLFGILQKMIDCNKIEKIRILLDLK